MYSFCRFYLISVIFFGKKQVKSITSSAFNKKHRLRSPCSTQSAALKLLEYDLTTRKEKTFSLSDPLLSLWLTKKNR